MILRALSLWLVTSLISIVFLPIAQAQDWNGRLRIVEATEPAPIREAPPGGLLPQYGGAVGELEVGAEYRVLETQRFRTLFNDHTWARVEAVETDGNGAVSGWVYLGSPDEIANFTVIDD